MFRSTKRTSNPHLQSCSSGRVPVDSDREFDPADLHLDFRASFTPCDGVRTALGSPCSALSRGYGLLSKSVACLPSPAPRCRASVQDNQVEPTSADASRARILGFDPQDSSRQRSPVYSGAVQTQCQWFSGLPNDCSSDIQRFQPINVHTPIFYPS